MESKIPSFPTGAISSAANLLFDAGPAMSHGKAATVGYVVAAFTLTRLVVNIFDGFARSFFGEPEKFLGINSCRCNQTEGSISSEDRRYQLRENEEYEKTIAGGFCFFALPTLTALVLGYKGLSAAQQGNMGRVLAIATIALGCFGLNSFSKLLGCSWRFCGHVWRDIDVRPYNFREGVTNFLKNVLPTESREYVRI